MTEPGSERGNESPAEEMRLRSSRPPVTRLSRKVLLGLGAVAAIGVAARLFFALTPQQSDDRLRALQHQQPDHARRPGQSAARLYRAPARASRSSARHCPAISAGRSPMRVLPRQACPRGPIPSSSASRRSRRRRGRAVSSRRRMSAKRRKRRPDRLRAPRRRRRRDRRLERPDIAGSQARLSQRRGRSAHDQP